MPVRLLDTPSNFVFPLFWQAPTLAWLCTRGCAAGCVGQGWQLLAQYAWDFPQRYFAFSSGGSSTFLRMYVYRAVLLPTNFYRPITPHSPFIHLVTCLEHASLQV